MGYIKQPQVVCWNWTSAHEAARNYAQMSTAFICSVGNSRLAGNFRQGLAIKIGKQKVVQKRMHTQEMISTLQTIIGLLGLSTFQINSITTPPPHVDSSC